MASGNDRGVRSRLRRAEAKPRLGKSAVIGLANPLRHQILVVLTERIASANELAKELGADYDKVRYEMTALKKADLIRLEAERKVRGTTELFYKATTPVCIDQSEWPSVPNVLKKSMRGALLQTVTEDAIEAISHGLYDSREHAHMSWTPFLVDERGWEEMTEILKCTLDEVIALRERCAKDLVDRDEKGISCTVSMLGHVSAGGERRAGPPGDSKPHNASEASIDR